MKKSTLTLAAFLMAAVISLSIHGCKKDELPAITGDNINNDDLTARTSSSVSGFVTDENNQPVAGAAVAAGAKATVTDQFGYFKISNADQVKNASFVTISKSGYFNGIKTWIGKENQPVFFRIKLIPKVTAGTVSGTTGGLVTVTGGVKLNFPAAAVVNASTNAAYTGTITVKAKWLDPNATDLNSIMPGDLRGRTAAGAVQALKTYGMTAVELTGSAGELLQVAPGKKVSMSMPIPSVLQSSAPATIPLWYFDETLGLWKEEGSAIKTGTDYVGDVSHFSFWNCDVPSTYVQVELTVTDGGGNPVTGALVKMSSLTNGVAAYGYTNSAGYVSGAIPNNSAMQVDIYATWNCTTSLFSQNFSTGSTNVSLGIISLNSNRTVRLTGNLTDCANAVVTNGAVYITYDNITTTASANASGNYSISFPVCTSTSATATVMGIDYANNIQAVPQTNLYAGGSNNTLNIQICGTGLGSGYLIYNNGTATVNYVTPADSVRSYSQPGQGVTNVFAKRNPTGSSISMLFQSGAPVVGQTYNVSYFFDSQSSIPGATQYIMSVTITEAGPVTTGYLSGTYSGVYVLGAGAGTVPVSGSFRAPRL